MFLYQDLQEAFNSLKAHKANTRGMGFGIMWAMLIFVVLQGGNNGFYNGTMKAFSYDKPILNIYPGETKHKLITISEHVANGLINHVSCFNKAMPIFEYESDVFYGYEKYAQRPILGVREGYDVINNLTIKEGRFLTKRDIDQAIPVCVLGKSIKEDIFGKKSAIGKFIHINHNITYVIGVFENPYKHNENRHVIISHTLSKTLFPKNNEYISFISAIPNLNIKISQAEKAIRTYLSKTLDFSPNNKNALWIVDTRQSKKYQSLKKLFSTMQILIFSINFCLLLSGIISMNNMMLATIQDRTCELMIRKIMGAKPFHIIKLILLETITISLISGMIGIILGKGIIQLINIFIIPKLQNYHVIDFEFSTSYILFALVVLGISGCFAGIISTKRAINIKPVHALNNE